MGLVPVDGVLATVMKVADIDEGAAATLVRLGLYESLAMQVDEHRPLLELGALDYMEERVTKARAAMLRNHVGKALSGEPEPSDLPYAEGLAVLSEYVEVSKDSLLGRALAAFNQQHPRDAKGRFVRANISQGNRSQDSQNNAETRRMQTEKEVEQRVASWKESGLVKDETPINLHFVSVDPVDGRPLSNEETELPSTANAAAADAARYAQAENGKLRLVGISVGRGDVPRYNNKQRAALDAMATLTGGDNDAMRLGGRIANQVGRDDLNWDNAGQRWNDRGPHQAYRRMKLTGQALNAVSAPGTPVSTIGGLAQLVGDLGPEAEKVVGPGIRRTAYRYRGTERRPDREIFREVQYANSIFNSVDTKDPSRRARALRLMEDQAISSKEQPGAQITRFYVGKPLSRDQAEMRASADIVSAHLMDSLPEEQYAVLSLASGEIPPSEGVLIDANGNVVSQSIGFKGDHYLPFDLKNLGRLQGGQYVRTRLSGGPTGEDIYTGLMAGARQVDVVSHSGVFTVEFDPTFRGGRRYSDKGRKMIRRYEDLVSTLASGDVVREDISPAEQARIRRQAFEAAGWDEQQGTRNFEAEMKRRRSQASVGVDDEEIEAEARHRAQESPEWRQASSSQRGEIVRDQMRAVRDEAGEAAYRMYRLDGPGYFGALKALKQEFPYYIRDVRWTPLPQWRQERNLPRGDFPTFGKPDRGYVKPGNLTPFDRRNGAGGERTEAEERETRGGARPGAAAPTTPGRPAAKITDAFKSEAFTRKVAAGIRASMGFLGQVGVNEPDIPANYSKDEARANSGAMAFTKWAWMKADIGNEDPEKFAKWLLNDASDEDRAAVEHGLEQVEEMAGDLGLAGVTQERVAQGRQTVDRLMHAARPFAEKAEDPVFADPGMKNPKPQPFDDLLVLNTEAKVDQFIKNAGMQDPLLLKALEDVTESPDDAADSIHELIDGYKKATDSNEKDALKEGLAAYQRAWSLFHVRETVRTLKALGLEAEDGPKAQSPSPTQPGEGEPGRAAKSLSRGGRPSQLRPLRGHSSPAAQQVVQKFLAQHR